MDSGHMKRYLALLGKCKLKPQWDSTTYLLEWLKFKRLIIPSGNDMKQMEYLNIAVGNEN